MSRLKVPVRSIVRIQIRHQGFNVPKGWKVAGTRFPHGREGLGIGDQRTERQSLLLGNPYHHGDEGDVEHDVVTAYPVADHW